MQYAVSGETDNLGDLDVFIAAMEQWLKSIGASIIERNRDDEDMVVSEFPIGLSDMDSRLRRVAARDLSESHISCGYFIPTTWATYSQALRWSASRVAGRDWAVTQMGRVAAINGCE